MNNTTDHYFLKDRAVLETVYADETPVFEDFTIRSNNNLDMNNSSQIEIKRNNTTYYNIHENTPTFKKDLVRSDKISEIFKNSVYTNSYEKFKDSQNNEKVFNRNSKLKRQKSLSIRPTKKRETSDPIKNNSSKIKFKTLVQKYLDHNIELAIIAFVTLFAMIGPDLKSLILTQHYDSAFNGFYFLVMFLFFVEFLASIWVKKGYYKSYYYWLDLFASISMMLEIDWILFPTVNLLISWSLENERLENKKSLIESKGNHKLIMTIRVLRIIRLIRIVKLYKAAVVYFNNLEKKKRIINFKKKKQERERILLRKKEERRKKEEKKLMSIEEEKNKRKSTTIKKSSKKYSSTPNKIKTEASALMPVSDFITNNLELLNNKENENILNNEEIQNKENSFGVNNESNISKALSESITQKVILIILLMLFISPITDDDVYNFDASLSYIILCKFINNYWTVYREPGNDDLTVNFYIENGAYDFYPIIEITYNNTQIWFNQSINFDTSMYRVDEKGYAFSPDGLTQITFSNLNYTKLSAGLNLGRTLCLIFILCCMAVTLKKDVKRYVLKPLEAMIKLVDSVANDPINIKNIENLKNKLNKNSANRLRDLGTNNYRQSNSKNVKNGFNFREVEGAEYEMRVIQMAIIKISALLAIGFGEAGGEILKENISSQEGLNPMMSGKKKCAIFGFCDIRQFTDINVALQEKTMVFVNEIADIVHSCVDKFSGSANKNMGDAFLTVWKFPHIESIEDADLDPMLQIKNSDPKLNSHVADQALLGYLNIIKKINKSQRIINYKYNSDIQTIFGDKFKVQMGFGLHYGWAIEGSIGSFYKIDCSYLSPNVNISARLEAATRQYGVSILISGELYDLLSPELKNICRIIDIVTVKGSVHPIRLYTVYTNQNLKISKNHKIQMTMKEKRKYYINKKEKLKEELLISKSGSIGKIVLSKKGFKELIVDKRRQFFYEKFQDGFLYYIDGNWEKAYYKFKDALFLDSNDGPTKTLFNYIKKRNKKCPENWSKCRELTSK